MQLAKQGFVLDEHTAQSIVSECVAPTPFSVLRSHIHTVSNPKFCRLFSFSHISKDAIVTQPALASLLLPRGQPLAAGVKLQRPLLAKTLSAIAANGADALYTGDIAENIVKAVSAADRQ
jgi:hypothetical protein